MSRRDTMNQAFNLADEGNADSGRLHPLVISPVAESLLPFYQDEYVTLYHGDCRELLPTLPDVSLVVTDPPYILGIASTGQEGKAGGWGDMMNSAYWYAAWLSECKRLTANKQGATWVFNSWRSFPILARAAYDARWAIQSLLVWDKGGLGPGGQQGLRPTYELAALFTHPQFALTNRSLPDVWQCPRVPPTLDGHPAAKPLSLLERIIKESSGDVILDPFSGSGSTLVAAKNLRKKAIGIEIEKRYCELAAKRLAQDVLPLCEAI